mgnify:CR=1 FL=1
MADDVLQLIDRLSLNAPAVLGHSMGGKTAMALALRHPQRVSRLIVVDIAPVSYADTLTPFAEAMRSADVLAAGQPRRGAAARCSRPCPDPGVVPFLMQNLVARNDHFDWRINLLGISAAMPQLCGFPSELLGARFDGPVTVIAGDELRLRGAARRRGRSSPMFSQVEVEVIADAGHWVHADQPAAFVARQAGAARQTQPTRAAHAL